jgi:hypothetical protein
MSEIVCALNDNQRSSSSSARQSFSAGSLPKLPASAELDILPKKACCFAHPTIGSGIDLMQQTGQFVSTDDRSVSTACVGK